MFEDIKRWKTRIRLMYSNARKWNAAWNASHPGRLVTLLPNWPPNSPDLTPIENVWGIVQREVDVFGCPTFDEFEALVNEKCQNFPQATLRNLVKSMGKRMRLVVAAEGDKIKY